MNRTEALEKARAAKGPLPPVQAGLIKMKKALLWVYRWGWSSSKIVEIVGGGKRSGLAARLVRTGFLKATKTESGGYGGGPAALLTLTEKGQNEVEKWIENQDDLLDYELNSYRINQDKIRHDELAQIATAKNLSDGSILDYITESMAGAKSEKSVKQHDIVWILKNSKNQGIEVELTSKWGRKFDEFILSCCLSINSKKVDQIFVVTDSKALKLRYQAAFEPGQKFGKWEKNDLGFSKKTGAWVIPDYMEDKVLCVVIE